MNISISPIKPNNVYFRATQNSTNGKSAKEKEILTPQKAMEKRTKITIGCCLATVLVVDVMYFVMKGKMKQHKIHQKEAKILKAKALEANRPETILEKLAKWMQENPNEKYENMNRWYKRVIGKV